MGKLVLSVMDRTTGKATPITRAEAIRLLEQLNDYMEDTVEVEDQFISRKRKARSGGSSYVAPLRTTSMKAVGAMTASARKAGPVQKKVQLMQQIAQKRIATSGGESKYPMVVSWHVIKGKSGPDCLGSRILRMWANAEFPPISNIMVKKFYFYGGTIQVKLEFYVSNNGSGPVMTRVASYTPPLAALIMSGAIALPDEDPYENIRGNKKYMAHIARINRKVPKELSWPL